MDGAESDGELLSQKPWMAPVPFSFLNSRAVLFPFLNDFTYLNSDARQDSHGLFAHDTIPATHGKAPFANRQIKVDAKEELSIAASSLRNDEAEYAEYRLKPSPPLHPMYSEEEEVESGEEDAEGEEDDYM